MKLNRILKRTIPVLIATLLLLLAVSYRITPPSADPDVTVPSILNPSGTTPSTKPKPTDPSMPTVPSQTGPTDPTQTDPTDPPQTNPTDPPQTNPTDPPQTDPTDPPQTEPEGPANRYTREELEALDPELIVYGPGRNQPGVRPKYPTRAQADYEQYDGHFIAPDNGCVYLTFDCGYEYYATDENGERYPVTGVILDVLKEKNVKAVFFVTLSYAKQQPELVQRMIDEGHVVGNHSTTHPKMPNLTIDQMISEVMTLHEYIETNFGYTMHLFRPPSGAFSLQSLAVVQNLGYKSVLWSFAYRDYEPDEQPPYQESLDLVTNCHHSGAIYLLHAVSVTNSQILPAAIDFFLAQGYTISLYE